MRCRPWLESRASMGNIDFVLCGIAPHLVIQCPILDFGIKLFENMEGKMVPSKSARWVATCAFSRWCQRKRPQSPSRRYLFGSKATFGDRSFCGPS